jgi:hypothetical protein
VREVVESERVRWLMENIVNPPVDRKEARRRVFKIAEGGDWSTASAVT